MEMFPVDQDDDDLGSVSPLNMTGAFTGEDVRSTPDISPAPSELDPLEDEAAPAVLPFTVQ